ncbi:DUF2235 domain-containing protein [Mesorhizobium sp. CAU 1732]|uniref:DUF2235 domain-containing protein n=1 Tax=Mesorhizobium sp. CAU 1732 TaxID=3140358 RepID=UPI003260F511
MPNPEPWCLIFSDGTGQRGVREDANVKNTNVFQMYVAVEDKPGFEAFYDPGLGAPEDGSNDWTRSFRNLWSKATGWGITANIVDCYEALLVRWKPGMRIGLFGFSRGAYTVRCLGGVLSTCGVATTAGGAPIPRDAEGPNAERRRKIVEEAVAAYKIKEQVQRQAAGRDFAQRYGAAPMTPDVVGVFDTVKALGLPGIMDMANPWKHAFHDTELSNRVPVGLHALSIDENRKTFAPVLWDDPDADAIAAGQVIEQCWFPGAHSDIGGGYEDGRLADLTLAWMIERLQELATLHIPLQVTLADNILGNAHDERTGMGTLWLPGERTIRGMSHDVDALCGDVEMRFDKHQPSYRPRTLSRHPRLTRYY